MSGLTGKTPKATYKDLLQMSNGNRGLDETPRSVDDGNGTASALQLSTVSVNVTGTLTAVNLAGTNTGDQSIDGLLPAQASNAGSFLSTDGSKARWASITGLQGPKGDPGEQGIQGPQGAAAAPGIAATIAVGTTITGVAGSQASIANVGSSSAAIFNFTIPQGPIGPAGSQGIPGAQGATGPQGPSSINGLIASGTNVTLTGSGTAGSPYVLSSSGGTPGGSSGQVQFNSSGSFAGTPEITIGNGVTVTSQAAGDVAFTLKAASGQSANIEEIYDQSGNLGYLISPTGAISVGGKIDENTTYKGITFGYGPEGDSPRALFGNGTGTQNWQIDNDSGTFRWFTPGVVRMTLDPTGNLALATGNFIPNSMSDGSAVNGSLYHSTTAGKLCFKDSGGGVNPLY